MKIGRSIGKLQISYLCLQFFFSSCYLDMECYKIYKLALKLVFFVVWQRTIAQTWTHAYGFLLEMKVVTVSGQQSLFLVPRTWSDVAGTVRWWPGSRGLDKAAAQLDDDVKKVLWQHTSTAGSGMRVLWGNKSTYWNLRSELSATSWWTEKNKKNVCQCRFLM